MPKPISPQITIAICTYNRADLLPGAVRSLAEQSLSPGIFEILVVDNASTEPIQSVVEGCCAQFPEHQIRYAYEPVPGLGRSRNLALQLARGRYIGYLDDDARAAPDWLEKALRLLDQPGSGESKEPICVGGPILPFYTTAKPAWFKDEYESRSWGKDPRRLNPGETFSGSNMIWRRESLLTAGGFAENVGVKGDTLSVGEEAAAFARLWRMSPDALLLYSPELVVYHWSPPGKMSVGYYLRRSFVFGQSTIRQLTRLSLSLRLRTLMRSGGIATLRLLWSILRLPFYPHLQNWAIEEGRPIATKLGVILAVLGIYISVRQR